MNTRKWIATFAVAVLSTTALTANAWAFQEAPMLTKMVEAGALPPVDERLPSNPTVVEAMEVGQYGGVWHRAYSGPGDRWGPTKLMEERVLKWTADANGEAVLKPGYIESYSVNDNSTEFTFTLLEGLKWSDGAPVTTDDVNFWYKDVFLNTAIVPNIDPTFAPGGVPLELEVKDERTFTIKFAQPYVYFLQILAKDSTGEPSLDRPSFLFPKHYLSQYNDHYASADELAAAAKKYNVAAWTDLWGSKGTLTGWWNNPDLPVLTAWKIETPAPAETVTMVRNPYYYAVDQEGNQLPYVDRIEHRLYQDPETLNLMVAQGQIDMQGRGMNLDNYTFYKENEDRGNFTVVPGRDSNVWSIIPNQTVKDEGLRALYQNADFRKALSISVDREAIIELTQSGLSSAMAVAPVNGSPYHKDELSSHWAEYDPDAAAVLLDGLGLTERDSSGFRLRSDGQRLSMTIETSDQANAKTLELLAGMYADVGIELLPRVIDRTQWDNNRDNNDFQLQWMPFDRLTYVPADPRLMLGSQSYGTEYFKWYQTKGASGIEPPEGSAIREMYADWDKASQALTIEEADASVNAMVEAFVGQGYAIGVYGEGLLVNIVSNDMHNFQRDLVQDDIFRGVGIARTQQLWLSQK